MTLDPLAIRRRLGRNKWNPPQPFGPDGWMYTHVDGASSVIVTSALHGAPITDWVHASIAHHDYMPTYDDLKFLHRSVFGADGWAYQVFAPSTEHVNIHNFALHLFGRLDGAAVLPDFTDGTGSI